jgi:SAM-dependent methyltransferases related to tRNA (uracil-5-)-methyltransferase
MHDQIVEAIVEKLPEVKSIVQNINPEKTNVLMGKENKTLWGSDTIEDQLLGLTFTISPLSFYQVNPQQTERLYQAAIDQAGLTGNETVIDAYCGIGTISLACGSARKAGLRGRSRRRCHHGCKAERDEEPHRKCRVCD